MKRLCREVRFREAERILIKNGYKKDKVKGSHHQYVKDGHRVVINLKLNRMVWQRIKKENNLED